MGAAAIGPQDEPRGVPRRRVEREREPHGTDGRPKLDSHVTGVPRHLLGVRRELVPRRNWRAEDPLLGLHVHAVHVTGRWAPRDRPRCQRDRRNLDNFLVMVARFVRDNLPKY